MSSPALTCRALQAELESLVREATGWDTPRRRTGTPVAQSVVQTLPDVSLDYAADHLLDAVRSVAVSEGPLHARLQTAWVESVQHVWEKPCLTTELLARFKALWDRVTDPTAGPRSTRLRELTASETVDRR